MPTTDEMLAHSIEQFKQALVSGDFTPMLAYFGPHLTVYAQDDVNVLDAPEKVAGFVMMMQKQLAQLSLTSVEGVIAAHSIVKNGRFRYFVEWTYHFAEGTPTRYTYVTNYCTLKGDSFVIDMMEVTQSLFDEVSTLFEDFLEESQLDGKIPGWGARH